MQVYDASLEGVVSEERPALEHRLDLLLARDRDRTAEQQGDDGREAPVGNPPDPGGKAGDPVPGFPVGTRRGRFRE